MQRASLKSIIFISIFLLAITSAVTFQANATSYSSNTNEKIASYSSTTTNPVFTIVKRINATIAQVNDSIIVELILTNVGNNPIYNINLTEPQLQNPNIIVKNLFTPLSFAQFQPNEQRIISYTFSSETVANVTIASTIATYQLVNSPTATTYTSYSNSVSIYIKSKTLSQSAVNLNNLIMISIIALFYALILLIRIFFNITKRSKNEST